MNQESGWEDKIMEQFVVRFGVLGPRDEEFYRTALRIAFAEGKLTGIDSALDSSAKAAQGVL